MVESENRNPSLETKKQIADGVNFVHHWLSERCSAGKITKDEYNEAIDKLSKVKILPTDRGTDRLIDAYEQGELKLSNASVLKGITIANLKEALLRQPSHAEDLRGLSTYWAEGPVILINIDKIKEMSNERSDLSSVVAHELTHCIGLKSTSEKEIESILYGKYGQTIETTAVPAEFKQDITIQIIPDTQTTRYIHNTGANKINSVQKPDGLKLNENVVYDPYTDKSSEIYARIMQMRFDMQLDPQKTYSSDDVEEMRQDLLKRRISGKQSGADNDINNRIFERYSNEQISHFLNDTAQNQPAKYDEYNNTTDVRQIMLKDMAKYKNVLASLDRKQDVAPKKQNCHSENDTYRIASLYKQREYS